ncbi:MAG: DUF58 domain-containing protein [Phycisphaerae bacterium]|nr:DUF58 domain-containing protein [Phycisphaerae bacterium]
MLTDPKFIQRLEMLFLLARKILSGSLKADRKTRKKGSGILFADHADYHFGDDYRNIDWSIYGRLEELMIKLFEREEDLTVYLLIDLSPSMQAKRVYVRKLAAALGYIALSNSDRLAMYAVSDRLETILPPAHGRARIFPMLRALEAAACRGRDTDFSSCFRSFQARRHRRGVCVVISDFFTPGGYLDALKYLRWTKQDVYCLQVLDLDELTCDWRGDVTLECVETGRLRKVTIGPVEAARYARTVAEWNQTLRTECARRRIGYARATIDVPFEDVIQRILRRGGLVA